MGQVHVQVVLTNYREAVLARLGQEVEISVQVHPRQPGQAAEVAPRP